MEPYRQRRRFELYLLLIFVLSLPLLNPWIRGDGVGYYAYVRAPLIEHNFDFTHDYQHANDSFREMRFDENGQIRAAFRTRTGHLDNHFTVGPGMLWAPFLLVAHGGVLLARVLGSNVAAEGFSAPYRYAMAIGTGVYGFLALLISFRLACKYVAPVYSFIATVAIWWGSSLPVYMYFNPSWSHAHSAFMVALFIWYWHRTLENRTVGQWVILGVITGVMLDVYYANLMVVIVIAVEALPQYARAFQSGKQSAPHPAQLFARHILFAATVAVLLLPTFISRWVVYGGPFESGYMPLSHYYWSSPVILSVLFSSNHGLISWTPLIAFAIIGLLLFAWRWSHVGMPLVAALLAFYLFFSLYPDWAGISSYGNRFFLSLTLFFILGLAHLLERAAAWFRQPRSALAASSAVLACFVLWNLGMIYQWGTHLIPARGPISFRQAAYNQFHVVPGELTSHVRAYILRRGELMRQIEQRDVEQLNKDAQP